MRKFTFVVAVIVGLTACADLPDSAAGPAKQNKDFAPVDGVYALALTSLRSVCAHVDGDMNFAPIDKSFPDIDIEVDAFLRPDEPALDLFHNSDKFPGFVNGVVSGVHRRNGIVNYSLETATEFSTGRIVLDGTITPTEMILDFEEDYTDEHNDCTFTGHAEGRSRPFADANALDGRYVADVQLWDIACPASDVGKPSASSLATFDIFDSREGEIRVSFGGGSTAFVAPKPSINGSFTYHGDIATVEGDEFGGSYPVKAHGMASGILRPDMADMSMTIEYPDYGETCGTVTKIVGRKLVADRAATENDYRMKFLVTDGCTGVSNEEYGTTSLINIGTGSYQLADPAGTIAVAIKGQKIHQEAGDIENDGFHAVFDGTASPPMLDYTVTIEQTDPATGKLCTTTIVAAGEVRYVFD